MEMSEYLWAAWQIFMSAVVATSCGWISYQLLFKDLRK